MTAMSMAGFGNQLLREWHTWWSTRRWWTQMLTWILIIDGVLIAVLWVFRDWVRWPRDRR